MMTSLEAHQVIMTSRYTSIFMASFVVYFVILMISELKTSESKNFSAPIMKSQLPRPNTVSLNSNTASRTPKESKAYTINHSDTGKSPQSNDDEKGKTNEILKSVSKIISPPRSRPLINDKKIHKLYMGQPKNRIHNKQFCMNFSFSLIKDLRSRRIRPSSRNRTIYFRSSGRLGNALFQIAGLYALADVTGSNVIVTAGTGLYQHPFKDFGFFKIDQNPQVESVKEFKLRHETLEYMSAIRAALKQDIKLQHFYQQLQFFEGCLETIKSLFKFRDDILHRVKSFIQNNILKSSQIIKTRNDVTLVGIHVRRGDYLDNYYKKEGYRVPDVSYFKRAMSYFRKKYVNVKFVVASNDREWVLQNLVGEDIFYSTFEDARDDLALISVCDHVIQSMGTFSWWAGFLCNGESVYYKDWIVKDSYIFKRLKYNPRDKFLPDWIPM